MVRRVRRARIGRAVRATSISWHRVVGCHTHVWRDGPRERHFDRSVLARHTLSLLRGRSETYREGGRARRYQRNCEYLAAAPVRGVFRQCFARFWFEDGKRQQRRGG